MILSVWARPAELCKDTEGGRGREGGRESKREREKERESESKGKRKRENAQEAKKVDSQAAQTSEKEGGEESEIMRRD